MNTNIFLLVCGLYALFMIAIGIYLKKEANKSMEEYGLASNRFGSLVLTIVSVGAWVGSGGLIGLASSSYSDGVMGYWEYTMAFVCVLPFVFLFLTRIKFLNLYTVPDFFALRFSKYNEAIRYPTGLLYLVRNATVLGMQLNALAFLFTSFFGWSHVFGVIISSVIVVIYTVMSGFLSVMVTNFIQSAFQTATPFVAFGFVLYAAGGWSKISEYYANLDLSKNLSLFNGTDWIGSVFYYAFTIGVFFLICDQGDWQRIGSAKNAKTAKKSFIYGTIIILPLLVVPCYIGAGARVVLGDGVDSSLVLYELIKVAGPIMGSLLLIGVLSTIMSCTSSYLFAGGMNASHDVIVAYLRNKGKVIDDKKEIFYSRIGVIICCLLGIVFALRVQGIIELWSAGLSICAAGLVPAFLFAWFSKKINTEAALASMFAGGGIAFIWTMLGNPFGFDAIWIGFPIAILICFVVPRFTEAPSKTEIEETYYFNPKFKNIVKSNMTGEER